MTALVTSSLQRRVVMAAVLGTLAAAPAAHAFGAPLDVASGASSGAAVAGHTGAGATVAWRRASDGAVLARSVSAGGALGTPITVAASSQARPPALATVPGGAVVAWLRPDDDHLLVRRVGDDGVLGTTYDVSGESLNAANGIPTVAANASGRVAVAWRRPSDSDVRVRIFEIGTGPSAPALDMTSDPDIALYGTNVNVAINDAGEAAVVWHRNTDCHILVRRVTQAGNAGAQIDLSLEPDSAVGDTTPTVALRPDGTVVGAWHRDADHHAVTRRWASDDSTSGFVDLSLADGVPSMANLAITPLADGDAVTWQRSTDLHVVAATGHAVSGPSPLDVSQAPSAASTPPAIATTPDGALAIAWVGGDGTARVAFSTGVAGPSPWTPTPTPAATPAPAPSPTSAPAAPASTPAAGGTSAPSELPGDHTAPQTLLRSAPAARTPRTSVTLKFGSSETESTFRCAIDGAAARPCTSPLVLRHLARGLHVVRIRAVDRAGNADASPVTVRFRVIAR